MSETENNPETKYTYALLMETSGEESESWYYFIRYQGNEDALKYLQEQLESVDWYIMDDLSTFDLELDYLVSEQTAKEMTKVDLNHTSHHRKFDGKLKMINLKFKPKDSTEKMMKRAFAVLSYGQIEDYVSDEDIDSEDLTDGDETSETSLSNEDNEDDTEETTVDDETKEEPAKKLGKLPESLLAKPRLARARQGKRKHGRKKN